MAYNLSPNVSQKTQLSFNTVGENYISPRTGFAYAQPITGTSTINRATWWLGNYPNSDGTSTGAYLELFRNEYYGDQNNSNALSLKCRYNYGGGMTNYNFATSSQTYNEHRIKSHQVYYLYKQLHATYSKNW